MAQLWVFVDFAAVTRDLRHFSLSGRNWHYACSLYGLSRLVVAEPARSKALTIIERRNGTRCGEEGNTVLWDQLLLPILASTCTR